MPPKKTSSKPVAVRLRDGSVVEVAAAETNDIEFAQSLRDAIVNSGLSQYRLSILTGIPQSALSGFLTGRDIRLSTFTKLAQVMGFELQQNPNKAPRHM